MNARKYTAEAIGTFWLVFAGIGSALTAAAFPAVGIGLLGVSLAVGLTVMTMAYTVGPVSGGHFNPAVTLGLVAGGRFPAAQALPYVLAQVLGGLLAGAALYFILSGAPGFDPATSGFASNGYAEHSPGKYSLAACFLAEVLLTGFFLFIIMGATHGRTPAGFAPIAIGLGLTLIHLVGIPITNLSVNPARSTATALFQGGWAIGQLWLFWAAPVIGGVLGALAFRAVADEERPDIVGDKPIKG